ncbi:hypothetical protein [Chakrabartyella piscis]|uniref:hypothetical protein n=1 Tax=Chakrabartyella piscis TaxID=2918914 RepID=UPI00295894E4|nr:hypothetical protein [Chakrabartyella piscis]
MDTKQLEHIMEQMGLMMDYAVYDLQFSSDAFFGLFLSSGVAKELELEIGNSNTILSGIQLARDVIFKSFGRLEETPPTFFLDKSPEYWAAWVLTYCQQKSTLSFAELVASISFEEVVQLYPALHQVDIQSVALLLHDKYQSHTATK